MGVSVFVYMIVAELIESMHYTEMLSVISLCLFLILGALTDPKCHRA